MGFRALAGVPEGSALLDVHGVRIAAARQGRGLPLVCLHAVGHGGRDYESFAARMKDHFHVIRLDWPGHGRSGEDFLPPEAGRYAELLHGVLALLGIERPIIVGNSIGGAAALHYASRHPVRALVLCNTGGLMPVTHSTRRACAVFARFFAGGERRAWWFKAAFRAYYRFLVLPMPQARDQRERIIAACHEVAPVLRGAWLKFGRQDADLRGLAKELDVPIWFAWAAQDRIIPLERNLPAIRQVKRASLTVFRGGHAAFLEEPEPFALDFLAFCGRHQMMAQQAEESW